jgi:hypothetical protein
MHAVLAPVLAQLITLGLADRSEGRYVVSEGYRHFEATTIPVAGLVMDWPRFYLRLTYSPNLTVAPLDTSSHDLYVIHAGTITAGYRMKRADLSLGESASYGTSNFRRLAVAPGATAPPAQAGNVQPSGSGMMPSTPPPTTTGGTGTATPGGGTTSGQTRAVNQRVRYASFRTFASAGYEVARLSTAALTVGYTATGGTDSASKKIYPPVQGPDAMATYTVGFDARNRALFMLMVQVAHQRNNIDTELAQLSTTYTHLFTKTLQGDVGVGIAYTRTPEVLVPANGQQPMVLGPVANSIFPTGHASVTQTGRLSRGQYTLAFNVSSAPVLNFTTIPASVDPRVGFGGNFGWNRDRIGFTAAAGSSVSVTSNATGLSYVTANAGVTYRLAEALSLDGGVRMAWQKTNLKTTIPLTGAAYVGLSFALPPISNHH